MQVEANAIAAGAASECVWIGEHPLTITLGRSLKAPSQIVAVPAHVPIVEIERGGGATLHNPGQLVVYPLLRLADHGLSPVSYLRLLEDLLIASLSDAGIAARTIAGQTGVWVGERKIASLGVSLAHGITRHGLALNVTSDLHDFAMISPCGFSADVMTRVADFQNASVADWAERVFLHLHQVGRGTRASNPNR
jgi:lipoate-protein ligase B